MRQFCHWRPGCADQVQTSHGDTSAPRVGKTTWAPLCGPSNRKEHFGGLDRGKMKATSDGLVDNVGARNSDRGWERQVLTRSVKSREEPSSSDAPVFYIVDDGPWRRIRAAEPVSV